MRKQSKGRKQTLGREPRLEDFYRDRLRRDEVEVARRDAQEEETARERERFGRTLAVLGNLESLLQATENRLKRESLRHLFSGERSRVEEDQKNLEKTVREVMHVIAKTWVRAMLERMVGSDDYYFIDEKAIDWYLERRFGLPTLQDPSRRWSTISRF